MVDPAPVFSEVAAVPVVIATSAESIAVMSSVPSNPEAKILPFKSATVEAPEPEVNVNAVLSANAAAWMVMMLSAPTIDVAAVPVVMSDAPVTAVIPKVPVKAVATMSPAKPVTVESPEPDVKVNAVLSANAVASMVMVLSAPIIVVAPKPVVIDDAPVSAVIPNVPASDVATTSPIKPVTVKLLVPVSSSVKIVLSVNNPASIANPRLSAAVIDVAPSPVTTVAIPPVAA